MPDTRQLVQLEFQWLLIELEWLSDQEQVMQIFHASVPSSVNKGTIIPVLRVVIRIIIKKVKIYKNA